MNKINAESVYSMDDLSLENRIKVLIGALLVLVVLLSVGHTRADSPMNHEKKDRAGLASVIREGLFTKYYDSASAASWRSLVTTLRNRGEILHAKRVAWICLFHPRVAGRRGGAMELINMTDLSDSGDVFALLCLDNDCLRNMFVELAEGGFFVKHDIAPHLAWLLENESYLRRNRRGRLVRLLRALYHYKDISVACKVARYLGDPIEKVRENAARTLGKMTGHTFSKTGDMDFTPRAYYIAKARIWWRLNKDRPEYNTKEKHIDRCLENPVPAERTGEDHLHRLAAWLWGNDFPLWGRAFRGLLEFGVENEKDLVRVLEERPSTIGADAVYGEILMRLCEFYNGKRETQSVYKFKKYYDIKEFCY